MEEIARPEAAGLKLLRDAADALALSARGYHRTLRVARTLADLDGEENVARISILPKPSAIAAKGSAARKPPPKRHGKTRDVLELRAR